MSKERLFSVLAATLALVSSPAPISAQMATVAPGQPSMGLDNGPYLVPLVLGFGSFGGSRWSWRMVDGQKALLAGRFEDAKKLLELSTKDGSLSPDSFTLAGLANLGAGYPRTASAWFKRALAKDQLNLPANQGLALTYVSLGKPEEARAIGAMLAMRLETTKSKKRQTQIQSAIAVIDRVTAPRQ